MGLQLVRCGKCLATQVGTDIRKRAFNGAATCSLRKAIRRVGVASCDLTFNGAATCSLRKGTLYDLACIR